MTSRPWHAAYEPGVPPTLNYPAITVADLLRQAAQKFPDRPALVYFGRRLTFGEVDRLASRVANGLIRLGVQPGDRVALFLPNTPQTVIAYYGALKAGAVVVQTNPLYSEEELAFQMNDSQARVVIALDLLCEKVKAVQSRTALTTGVFVRVHDFFPPLLKMLYPLKARFEKKWVNWKSGPGWLDFMEWLRGEADRDPAVPVQPSETALLQYTGGTTGRAKGAMLTHANLVANACQCKALLTDFQEGGEIILGALPFFHVYGMTVCLNLSMLGGATLVLFPRFEVKGVLRAIQKYRPTIFPGVPAMYSAINNFPGVEKYDLKSIRACISGAGALLQVVQETFERLTGGKLVEGYGLTEASPVTHCNPLRGLRKTGSIGLPVSDTDAKIVDVETGTRELGIGEAGELCVKGPQVMKGYWNRPEENAQAIRDGWLYTGDIAKRDEQGFFFMVDRKKEMIKSRGENVYPRDIEEVLARHDQVKEVAVVGLPDPRYGEKIRGYVVLKEGAKVDEAELIAYCERHLAKFQVPHEIRFRQELPKTLIGKVLRRVLVEEAKREVT